MILPSFTCLFVEFHAVLIFHVGVHVLSHYASDSTSGLLQEPKNEREADIIAPHAYLVILLSLSVRNTNRGVDLVTALATPLTYEGLIDDLIGIQNG